MRLVVYFPDQQGPAQIDLFLLIPANHEPFVCELWLPISTLNNTWALIGAIGASKDGDSVQAW